MNKIFLFDCDETIWTSLDADYISHVSSSLTKISKVVLYRKKDGKLFNLKPEIPELFKAIRQKNHAIGIVSDNKKDMVISALILFDICKLVDTEAINIKLWDGHCPKELMVSEILNKPKFAKIPKNNVYWFDDKDYSEEAKKIEVNFVKVNGGTNLTKIVKKLLDC